MRFKGTAALSLLLALLGGYVYWTEIRGREERERAEADAVKLLPVDPGEIAGIRLTYADATFEARRTDSGWEFVDPEGIDADRTQWDTLAGNVPRIEFDEVVRAETGDLAAFGLDRPRVRIEIELADGTEETILFGSRNPGGNAHYVQRGSTSEILLAATSWSGLFEKDLAGMRDKTILRFDQDAIDRIEVDGVTSLALVRSESGEGWHLEAPVDWPAESSRVTTLLATLSFARAFDFADALSDDEAGFTMPAWRVRIESNETGSSHELVIGALVDPEAEGPQYYARDTSRSAVFVIDAELPDMLERPAIDWRNKRIAAFNRDQVMAIEIDGETTVRISRADPASPWMLDSGENADPASVLSLLDALEFGLATSIVDAPGPLGAYGLDAPRLQVVLAGASGEVLVDGAFGADASDSSLYWRTSAGEVVFEVSDDVLDALAVDPAALVDTEAIPAL